MRETSPVGLPGPRGLPGLGSLVPFARDALGFLESLARDYGDLVHFTLADHDLVMVSDPVRVEEILVGHGRGLHKDAIYEKLRPLLGNGLVTSEDEAWRHHRKLAAPSFTRRHVEVYAEAMVACANEYVQTVPDALDLHEDMMGLTQRIVLHTLFGRDLTVDPAPVLRAIDAAMAAFVSETQGIHRLIPDRIVTPMRWRMRRAVAGLDDTLYTMIEDRRRIGLGDDLLSRLIAARDDDGVGFDAVGLRDEVVTAFVAGHETTALALTYSHILLAEHPEVFGRLRAEVTAVLGDRRATADDLARLPFTTAVIKESMRLLPPVWGIGRQVVTPLVVGGHRLPAGCQILISQWILHHDPRWFEDPTAFRPDRWLVDMPRPRMAYLPFGAGPRICIGNHFAMLEAVLVLATLARRIQLVPTGPRPPLVPSITLRPGGPTPARCAR